MLVKLQRDNKLGIEGFGVQIQSSGTNFIPTLLRLWIWTQVSSLFFWTWLEGGGGGGRIKNYAIFFMLMAHVHYRSRGSVEKTQNLDLAKLEEILHHWQMY